MEEIRSFMLSTIEHYYNISKLDMDVTDEEALSNFIYNAQTLLVQCFLENKNKLKLSNKIQNNKIKSVIFYKTSAGDLTKEDALENINIITLLDNVASSLYQVLRQIYSPLLTTDNDLYSSKLQKNLSDIESNLRIIKNGKGDNDRNVILSVDDEVDYWLTVEKNRDCSVKEKEAASIFCGIFQDICEEIKSMHSSPMEETKEAVENIGGLLDDIWRVTVISYPQNRMIHVFDIIGHIVCSFVQKTLSEILIWEIGDESRDKQILTLLAESLNVIQSWLSVCTSLTNTYWPNYALHPWTGKSYMPQFFINFQNRTKEIFDIRSTHSQMNKLLSKNERNELKIDDLLFECFKDINIWICNGPNQKWYNAVSRFSANLRSAETKLAEKLKPRLHNTSTKQMLYEFTRYKSLIERPNLKRALNAELEVFVSSLASMLKSIQEQLEADEFDVKMYHPPEMSMLVKQVQWAKQMEAKVKDIHICADKYLKELEGSAYLSNLATKLLTDLKTVYTQLHEDWCRDLQAQVKSGSLALSVDKPVVDFSASNQLMIVNFNPRLVWVEQEARTLSAMGLPSPVVAGALDTLTAALKHARALQQVASYHNTLGERMIPSIRPMMLQAALDLSSLVQDQKAVYWDDLEQLAAYTDKLKQAVLKLESQNTYLTSQHLAIRNVIEKLMDTDLLSKQSEWKKKITDIRNVIEKVEANGYKNTEAWRAHWDSQLYKALECQYIKTVLSLHRHFPHVKVDLVLRGRAVRVQPSMEEIRVQHYHQLRRLVSLPAQFVGLQNSVAEKQSIFATIIDKHSWLGNKAVRELEAALSAVERTCEAWTRRAALACVPDLDALCREHLNQPLHWELNFKACKAYGQAVAKMTFDDEKIDWISVGTATLRREFEAQVRNLWTCLMSSLQASCREEVLVADTFIANATVMLEYKALPKNAKELAEISAKQQALRDKMPEMEKTIESLKRKSHMLRTWGGEVTGDSTIKEWQKISELMLTQQQMFEHQAEIVRSSLNGEWDNLNTSVEAWSMRWIQARARLEETHNANYEEMVVRCCSVFEAHAQWEKFVADREDLLKECDKFNMIMQSSDIWQEIEKTILDDFNIWKVFNDYNEEYEAIALQEWIVFQKKIHLLDELVSKWSGRLEPYTTVTLFLQQQLDKYSGITSLLRYLRGFDFTERHWREVYSLLEIEYKKPDTLQVKDLLNVAGNIRKHIKTLQKISASASSESAIRSALNELELWFAGARFTITYYSDKSKHPVPIVKDFKNMIAKIEEQQWVVSGVSGGESSSDASAAWAARLRSARSLARSAHNAQRR